MGSPDVWITPLYPVGAPRVGFGLLGDATNAVYSTGSYSWTAIDRPAQKGFVEYTATQLTQLTLPLLLDRADTGDSVENECNMIHSWRYPTPGRREPPPLQVTGPIDTAGITEWVLLTPVWKTAIRRADFQRTQQELELTLVEASFIDRTFQAPTWTAQQQIAASSSAASAATPSLAALPPDLLSQLAAIPAGSWSSYVVKIGEDLQSIAAKQLGDFRLWQVVAQLNGLRDPTSVSPGHVVRLPW